MGHDEPAIVRDEFSLEGKIVALRLFRLGQLPPALYQAEAIAGSGLPIVAVEFGNVEERVTRVPGLVPRVRLRAPWARLVPRPLRPLFLFFRAAWFLLASALFGERPALVIAHGLQEQCLAWLLSLVTGTRYAVDVHEVYEKRDLTGWNRLWFALEGPALRRARFLLFPEKERLRVYRERYGLRQPLYPVFNCPPRRLPGPRKDLAGELGLPRHSFLLLYLGGVGPANALDAAIEAVASVEGVALLVAGWGEPGYVAELERLAASLGAASRVRFLGPVADRWRYLDSCDAAYCVYRPLWLRLELAATASNKLMEAIAAGLPVITAASGGFREIVEDEGIGVCVGEISGRAVADALQRLARDPALRESFRSRALGMHASHLHYEAQFAPALEQIRRAVGGLPAARFLPEPT